MAYIIAVHVPIVGMSLIPVVEDDGDASGDAAAEADTEAVESVEA